MHAYYCLVLHLYILFTRRIDGRVGTDPRIERVTHSGISYSQLEIVMTAWPPLPAATNEQ